ncbi:MAG: hypothetical protein V7K27_33420 [Nostoc sp.]|uniref:hypothetical protein n=1 Tax=Nostoc sp. TaxID=1180 RepID=UPI002FF562F5
MHQNPSSIENCTSDFRLPTSDFFNLSPSLVRDGNGNITLVAQTPTVNPVRSWLSLTSSHAYD